MYMHVCMYARMVGMYVLKTLHDKQRLLEDSPKYWASRLPEGLDPFWDQGL